MIYSDQNLMIVNGLSCALNLPIAPRGEGVYQLPPYAPIIHQAVDDYECPPNWEHGSSKASSFFLKVEPGRHLWLDFNMNLSHTHHVAVVCSIQGINPISGEKTKELILHQFRDNCPVHKVPFQQDRFCPACDKTEGLPSKWAPQNYMATNCWPTSSPCFWIDGWRVERGVIRGFLITEETLKGVATQLIGDERVWAIGVAFFLSKEPKPVVPSVALTRGITSQSMGSKAMFSSFKLASLSSSPGKKYLKGGSGPGGQSCGFSGHDEAYAMGPGDVISDFAGDDLPSAVTLSERPSFGGLESSSLERESKVLEVAAGAKISQDLDYCDLNDPNSWQPEPAGLIYINYVDSVAYDQIIRKGKKDRNKTGDGFLGGLKVGNL